MLYRPAREIYSLFGSPPIYHGELRHVLPDAARPSLQAAARASEIQQPQPGRADIHPVGPTRPPRTPASGWPWVCVSFGAGLQAMLTPPRGLAASQQDPWVCCKPLLHQQSPLCPLWCTELCSHTGRAAQTISWHSTGIQPTKLHFFPLFSF